MEISLERIMKKIETDPVPHYARPWGMGLGYLAPALVFALHNGEAQWETTNRCITALLLAPGAANLLPAFVGYKAGEVIDYAMDGVRKWWKK
jgi:hypothetical protein